MERNGKADQAGLADLLIEASLDPLGCDSFGRFDEPLAGSALLSCRVSFKLMFKYSRATPGASLLTGSGHEAFRLPSASLPWALKRCSGWLSASLCAAFMECALAVLALESEPVAPRLY
jgi:hypothetical protein